MIGLSIGALRSIEDVSSRTLSIAFLTSSISVSRIASSNWRWKSDGRAAELAGIFAEGAHQGRQVLGTDDDDRNDGDHEKLRPTDVEHGRDVRPKTGLAKSLARSGSLD